MKAHTFEQKDSQEKKLNDTTGELTLTNILITHGKQHYLLHPLFETFIKVNILTYTLYNPPDILRVPKYFPTITNLSNVFSFFSVEVAQN